MTVKGPINTTNLSDDTLQNVMVAPPPPPPPGAMNSAPPPPPGPMHNAPPPPMNGPPAAVVPSWKLERQLQDAIDKKFDALSARCGQLSQDKDTIDFGFKKNSFPSVIKGSASFTFGFSQYFKDVCQVFSQATDAEYNHKRFTQRLEQLISQDMHNIESYLTAFDKKLKEFSEEFKQMAPKHQNEEVKGHLENGLIQLDLLKEEFERFKGLLESKDELRAGHVKVSINQNKVTGDESALAEVTQRIVSPDPQMRKRTMFEKPQALDKAQALNILYANLVGLVDQDVRTKHLRLSSASKQEISAYVNETFGQAAKQTIELPVIRQALMAAGVFKEIEQKNDNQVAPIKVKIGAG